MINLDSADAFLKTGAFFKLGTLDTEGFHPLTRRLARDAQTRMPRAVAALQKVDAQALRIFARAHAPKLPALADMIAQTFARGGRVFLCGCGATGRLSLALERLCKEGLVPRAFAPRVRAFMSGGDAALIRSIEAFEDHADWGARQLEEADFRAGDALLASTEGGETPWVIGAAQRAAEISPDNVAFLFCNPAPQLKERVPRSRAILSNPRVRAFDLATGPMAVSGSTRMQASTILMAAIGFALAHFDAPPHAASAARAWALKEARLCGKRGRDFPAATAVAEAELYRAGGYTLYRTRTFGLAVLTDTTERAPTFSLPIFESAHAKNAPLSLCYLSVPRAKTAAAAWRALLGRAPRCLEWENCRAYAGRRALLGFDISEDGARKRRKRIGEAPQRIFEISGAKHALVFKFSGKTYRVEDAGDGVLERNLLLKMLLNAHSTAVMARLGRLRGNMMTFVKPSNGKLIDRAMRYVARLRAEAGLPPVAPRRLCRALFDARETLKPDEPIVVKVFDALKAPAPRKRA